MDSLSAGMAAGGGESAQGSLGLSGEEIRAGLRRLGLGRGDMIEVHSALSRLGWVRGGAATVVDALMAVVGEEGTLAMSAYPLSKPLPLTDEDKARGIWAKVRLYDLDYEGPTGMGAIADEFRRRPGTALGPGFHRVCAWGHQAQRLAEGYHRLLEADGWALLLGVGIGSCSSMHQGEKAELPERIAACFRIPADLYLDYGGTPRNAWEAVLAEAERRELVRHGRIGRAECLLFRARAVVGIYEEARRTDPWALYGLSEG
jgi:aminoglycoside 3-N-acetyltransferase